MVPRSCTGGGAVLSSSIAMRVGPAGLRIYLGTGRCIGGVEVVGDQSPFVIVLAKGRSGESVVMFRLSDIVVKVVAGALVVGRVGTHNVDPRIHGVLDENSLAGYGHVVMLVAAVLAGMIMDLQSD